MKFSTDEFTSFDFYQSMARHTAVYPDIDNNLIYPVLGLASEAGEVCGKVKKVLRDKGGVIDDSTREALSKELGDVLWYLSNSASELNISLGDIALENLEKLYDRKERGVLKGDGDNR